MHDIMLWNESVGWWKDCMYGKEVIKKFVTAVLLKGVQVRNKAWWSAEGCPVQGPLLLVYKQPQKGEVLQQYVSAWYPEVYNFCEAQVNMKKLLQKLYSVQKEVPAGRMS